MNYKDSVIFSELKKTHSLVLTLLENKYSDIEKSLVYET